MQRGRKLRKRDAALTVLPGSVLSLVLLTLLMMDTGHSAIWNLDVGTVSALHLRNAGILKGESYG